MIADWARDRLEEAQAALAFCTRLPLSPRPSSGSLVARAVWAFPLAGLVVGFTGAAIYALAHRIGLPPWPAAVVSLGATLLLTGCLHEDGLADTADGFGGGASREQKLDIMRDSRIGSYGVCALAVALMLRAGAIAGLAATLPVGFALLAAHSGARATMPVLMALLPPARQSGLSFAAGGPPREAVVASALLGAVIIVVCLGPLRGMIALLILAAVVAAMAWLARRQIGGQTGDVLGALEQLCEIAVLLVAVAFPI
jgi:adenosylcobinamide-GDP ribazoletransferase